LLVGIGGNNGTTFTGGIIANVYFIFIISLKFKNYKFLKILRNNNLLGIPKKERTNQTIMEVSLNLPQLK